MENQQKGRRTFIKKSAAALALMGLGLPSFGHIQNKQTLKVALIGCGWYGKMDLWRLIQIANVDVVALCDVDQNHLKEAESILKERLPKSNPKLYKDYKKLLESAVKREDYETAMKYKKWIENLEKINDLKC
jgi:predicted homoserine dehydrogenase-like protein